MFISLSSTCIQNFSNWNALFVFFFITFCSRCGMNWDTACRLTNDPFWAFGLPLSFLPSRPSFLHDHSTAQHSNFSSFLAISTTDKPVNRSIQAYALTQLNVFALRGFIFRDIHKKQGRHSSNSGYEIQKICDRKIYSRTRTFGAEVHKSNIRVKRSHKKYENSELYWKTQLWLKWFSYQVQSY